MVAASSFNQSQKRKEAEWLASHAHCVLFKGLLYVCAGMQLIPSHPKDWCLQVVLVMTTSTLTVPPDCWLAVLVWVMAMQCNNTCVDTLFRPWNGSRTALHALVSVQGNWACKLRGVFLPRDLQAPSTTDKSPKHHIAACAKGSVWFCLSTGVLSSMAEFDFFTTLTSTATMSRLSFSMLVAPRGCHAAG